MGSEIIRGRVPAEVKKAFLAIAADKGLTESAAVSHLVQQFVEKEQERKKRDTETMEALTDMEAGVVVDGARVRDWIASWGNADELEHPR